ncbi:ABC transporter ATP-binding protein/permease [Stella sp.]|uniref:ABC transporter ATP-binding protein/permease n=1 Tax=Stella sp. TaxID=2912054 RepID=UPI0035AE1518
MAKALSAGEEERRLVMARFWQSALGFWRGPGWAAAWSLTVALVAIVLAQIAVQYQVTVWNREFFDALERRDGSTVLSQCLVLLGLVAASVALGVASVAGRFATHIRWRRFLSRALLEHWFWNGRYYRLNLMRGDHDNPELRIADDARLATDAPIDFAVGLLSAAVGAATFVTVLWRVGGSIAVAGWTVPGYLVIAAVLYSGIATAAMMMVGRRFVAVAERKNAVEADFRYFAVRLRENGESIALLGGEAEEREALARRLERIGRAWWRLAGQHMRTTTVSQTNTLLAPTVPLLLCAPKYLSGTMSLGDVMQAATAFVAVQTAFNWLVDNYPRLADWKASAVRVGSLLRSLDVLEHAEAPGTVGQIVHGEGDGPALRLSDVSVTLDDGTSVVAETDFAIARGQRVLVVGESGSGKSTLLRAIAGLWPWGGGEVRRRRGASVFFMPQRPYLPIGSLKRVAAYPQAPDAVTDAAVRTALETAELGHLASRLDDEDDWDRILSGGEKQRIAFARMFLLRPDIVIMDEATSALDARMQDAMMRRLATGLPDSAVVSVGHRSELEQFHDRRLTLARHPDGAQLVRDEALARVRDTAGWLARRLSDPGARVFRRGRKTRAAS